MAVPLALVVSLQGRNCREDVATGTSQRCGQAGASPGYSAEVPPEGLMLSEAPALLLAAGGVLLVQLRQHGDPASLVTRPSLAVQIRPRI